MVLKQLRGDEGGAVAVLVALLSVVFFSLAALVVDLGIARDNRRQAQNTADASALAAANALYATTQVNANQPGNFAAAVRAAKETAASNYGVTEADWAGCSLPSGEALPVVWQGSGSGVSTSCISFDRAPYPNNVLVVVPLRKMPTLFGGVVGYQGVSISALAQAQIVPAARYLCTFCVVKDTTHDLQNGTLNVVGGNMWFNGDVRIGPEGAAGSLPGTVMGEDGEYYDAGGEVYTSGDVLGTTTNLQSGKTKTRSPRIVDPLAANELPFATQSTLTLKSDPCSEGPGIYDGYKLNGGTCTLEPGLYVFTDDLELAGNNTTNFVADGVTMYFTCGTNGVPAECSQPGETGAGIKITGNGTYSMTAPLRSTHPDVPSELYGWSVVYDRYNTEDIFLAGNGTQTLTGTIYALNATMDNRGNGCTTVTTSMVVIGEVGFSGTNSCFTTVFDASKNARPQDGSRGLVR